ncbi:TetR/AcrR family transcriptional regulator [Guyparkeria sp.]|uniref:TetR/AcrR family transcriptional regulator n=1 Tax=Guyparkeria sp. TaxID=2035736 RepID=UPI003970F93F
MARTPAFERDEVLTEAMKVFWSRGYNRTSMRDLTQATRLNPGSIYAAFRNKQGVFLESVDLYTRALRRETEAALGGEGNAAARIRRFFDNLLDSSAHDPENKGCLLINTLIEAPADEPELRRRAGEALKYVEGRFAEVLAEGQTEGVIRATASPERQARLLMTGIFGLRVYARMPEGRDHAREIVDTLLQNVIRSG